MVRASGLITNNKPLRLDYHLARVVFEQWFKYYY